MTAPLTANAPVGSRCQDAWRDEGVGMVEVLLREHNHGAIGAYAFQQLPTIDQTINMRQMDKSTYFEVIAVEHIIREPGKPASVTVSVKRVVKWPT